MATGKVLDTSNMKKGLYGWGINDAEYSIKTRVGGKWVIAPEYSRWISVVQRPKDPKEKARKPSYKDVYCSDKWRHFTDFSNWLDTQPYWKELYLDKDILIKGNKEYGPDTCVFIPQYLNNLLHLKAKSTQFLVGVSITKFGKYNASSKNSFEGNSRSLGNYDTELEAHAAWQVGKAYIVECAINKYATEPWFRTDVADALMSRVWSLRLSAATGVVTTDL